MNKLDMQPVFIAATLSALGARPPPPPRCCIYQPFARPVQIAISTCLVTLQCKSAGSGLASHSEPHLSLGLEVA